MNRLLATAAILALLAAPAWAQTMSNSPSKDSDSMSAPAASAPADTATPAPAPAPMTPAKPATTQGSGSSVRHIARSHHARSSHAGDHSADKLNRQELQNLPQPS